MSFKRREFLKSAGATAASAALWSLLGGRALAATPSPKRIIYWWVPEGIEATHFWPAQTGPLSIDMSSQLTGSNNRTWILQPLKAYESKISLAKGFYVDWSSADSDYHRGAIKASLSAADSTSGGTSVDDLIGAEIQGTAQLPFVRMGVQGWYVNASDPTYTKLFYKNGNRSEVDWSPARVFNSVFPGGLPAVTGMPMMPGMPAGPSAQQLATRRLLTSRMQLLGSTKGALKAIECQGGKQARTNLESYLASIDGVETRTQSLLDASNAEAPQGGTGGGGGGGTTSGLANVKVDVNYTPSDAGYYKNDANLAALGKLMMDVAVATLAFDRSRQVTLQWSCTGNDSHSGYAIVPGIELPNFGDHRLAHSDQGQPIATIRRDRARVFRWYATQLAYLLDSLAAIPEGDGTLLDHTAVVWVSDATDIDHVSDTDSPFLIAGSAGGAFKTGQFWNAASGNSRRTNGDMLLTLARGLGSSIANVGLGHNVFTSLLSP